MLKLRFIIITVIFLIVFSFPIISQEYDEPVNTNFYEQELPSRVSGYVESIAVIPDTQYYTTRDSFIRSGYRNYYDVQAKHITGSYGGKMLKYNIKTVFHLGDHVNWTGFPGILNADWNKVLEAVNIFYDQGMQFLPVEGNHDSKDGTRHGYFERTFSDWLAGYKEMEWYVDNNQGTRNLALKNRINERDYVFISLEYDADPEDLGWADDVINKWIPANLPDARVFIVTHSYLQTQNVDGRYELKYTDLGDELWEGLIKNNPAIDFVICGHRTGDMIRKKNRINGTVTYPQNQVIGDFEQGIDVYEILIDYQADKRGGNGWYKIFKFASDANLIYMDVERLGSNSERFTHEKYPEDPLLHNFIVTYP